MRTLPFRIFFIGFHRCGTTSLHRWLQAQGVNSFHGGSREAPILDYAILARIAQAQPPLFSMDDYDAYVAVRPIQDHFRLLDQHYPGSKFVLNTRDVESFLKSRLNLIDGHFSEFMNLYFYVSRAPQEWVDLWRSEFIAHHQDAIAYFKGRDCLHRFDIDRDCIDDLAAFLGLPAMALPRENVTATRRYDLAGGRVIERKAHS